MGLFAHPDDAAVLCGGTLARYARSGADVTIVSLTGGPKAGEMRAAADALGVHQIVLLDLPEGTLAARQSPTIEEGTLDLFQRLHPEVVLTFGPDGLDRQPDHVAVHAGARGAFLRLRNRPAVPVVPTARLYFAAWPAQHMRRRLGALRARGIDTCFLPDPDRCGSSDSTVTTMIDVRSELPRKLAALRVLRGGGGAPAVPQGLQLDDLWGHEFYTRAYPYPWVTGVIERDLLTGLGVLGRTPALSLERLAG